MALRKRKFTDAEPVRQHVRVLVASGWAKRTLARRVGMSDSYIGQLLEGSGSHPPPAMMHADVAAALLAIESPMEELSLIGTRRRLEGLMWMRHNGLLMSAQTNLTPGTIAGILSGRIKKISPFTYVSIRRYYEKMWRVDGESQPAHLTARARGYAPPIAWASLDAMDDGATVPRSCLVEALSWLESVKRPFEDVLASLTDSAAVDAEPVRRHIQELVSRGMPYAAIGARANCRAEDVRAIHCGLARDEPPLIETRAGTARAILRVELDPLAVFGRTASTRDSVYALGARRRLEALLWMNHSEYDLARSCGVSQPMISRILHAGKGKTPERISWELHRKVVAVYEQLWNVWGRSSKARTLAETRGYAPPMAWDDEAIDDPEARPYRGESHRTPVERGQITQENMIFLHGSGASLQETCQRLGISRGYVLRTSKELGLVWRED